MLYPVTNFRQMPQYLDLLEIIDPLKVTNGFFSKYYHLPDVVALLHKWLRSAFAGQSRLGKKDIIDILYLQEQLFRLIEAAGLLAEMDNCPGTKENNDNQEPVDWHAIINVKQGLDLWDSFPRHLSAAEIAAPCIALKKCFHHKTVSQWCNFLHELFNSATENHPIDRTSGETDIYQSCQYLFKLIEACHLMMIYNSQSAYK